MTVPTPVPSAAALDQRRLRFYRALERGAISTALFYVWVAGCSIGAHYLGRSGIAPWAAAAVVAFAFLWTGGFFLYSRWLLLSGRPYRPRLLVTLVTTVGSLTLLAFNVLDGFSLLGAILLISGTVLNLAFFAEANGFRATFLRSCVLAGIYGIAYLLAPHNPHSLDAAGYIMVLLVVLAIGVVMGVVAANNQKKTHQIVDLYKVQQRQSEELASANARLRELSMLDGLTGVANRRHFDEALERELGRLHRHREAATNARAAKPATGKLSLVLIDVDHFKAYNDLKGHLAGDECLRQVAQAMSRALKRPADNIARYGGEEFAVLLPETTLEGAALVAGRILQAIDQLRLPHPASSVGPTVTASAGVADSNCDPEHEAEDLISRADAALYRAKANGRGRLEVAPPRTTSPGKAPSEH
jgi:diguanylate cyclase (GGDEF)-like protein